MYSVRIERDSISSVSGRRLTTVVVRLPWSVIQEVVTHRTMSDGANLTLYDRPFGNDLNRNSASSRAIPIKRTLEMVRTEPCRPLLWGATVKGMQSVEVISEEPQARAEEVWLQCRDDLARHVEALAELGLHKQVVNPLLVPFLWLEQVITATDISWSNFFGLRTHEAARPELRRAARMIYLAMQKSTPVTLEPGQWHCPFVPLEEQMALHWEPILNHFTTSSLLSRLEIPELLKFSAARCAWVSYLAHDADGSREKMLRTWDTLVGSIPKHCSPLEHIASPYLSGVTDVQPEQLRSNLQSWLQLRKLLAQEKISSFTASPEMIKEWVDDDAFLADLV